MAADRLRIVVLVADDLYVRSFVTSGAFDDLAAEHDLIWVANERLTNLEAVQAKPGFVGTVPADPRRMRAHLWICELFKMVNRRRSRSMRIRVDSMSRRSWIKGRIAALPGVRHVLVAYLLRRMGRNAALRKTVETCAPDLVVAPTAGNDLLVHDLVREARSLGIPSLLLVNGWDNLASKATFTTRPDFIGVWGEQSVEHAVRIHRFAPDQVFPLGVPTFQRYFEFDPALSASPYPFRYVLFAGCAVPFDERTALRAMDDALVAHGIEDVRVVYRPHPWRVPRAVDDSVREEDFRYLTIDAQVRQSYVGATGPVGPEEFLPELGYYPGLIGNAEFVVCPLSTMVVEAAILERRVLVLAYDDHVHDLPPSVIAQFEHFDGIDTIDGFERVDRLEDLGAMFITMLDGAQAVSLRGQIRPWLYYDDATYGQRLAALVARLPVASAA